MKLLIIIYHLLNIKEEGNTEVTNLIVTSEIPEDCKLLYLAVTIKESGWHKSKRAILNNNYSGFIGSKGLKKFSSLFTYKEYLENWFRRKHIKNKRHLSALLNSGRYCRFKNNKDKIIYMSTLFQIEKQITKNYIKRWK